MSAIDCALHAVNIAFIKTTTQNLPRLTQQFMVYLTTKAECAIRVIKNIESML